MNKSTNIHKYFKNRCNLFILLFVHFSIKSTGKIVRMTDEI